MVFSVWCRNTTTCLSSGLTRCLGLGSHGSLQLDGEAGIFAAKENGVTAHDLALLQQLYSSAPIAVLLPLYTTMRFHDNFFYSNSF